MGMTSKQYWDEDCALVIPYRKAYRIRQEEINNNAWLQGLYIWKALQTSPIYVNGFVPEGARIEPYYDRPIEFGKETKKTAPVRNEEKMQNAVSFMERLSGRFNRQMENKQQNGDPPGKE